MTVSIIYIAGYGRSRSTFLERWLQQAGNGAVLSGGELAHLVARLKSDSLCQCGASLQNCEVWSYLSNSHYTDDAFLGFGLIRISDRESFHAIAKAAELSGYTHVVDSSKTATKHMLRPFQWKRNGYSVHTLLPIRALNEVVQSRIARAEREHGQKSRFSRVMISLKTVLGWYLANIAGLTNYPTIIDSADLAMQPEEIATDLLALLSCVPKQSGGGSHIVAGNRMRHKKLSQSPPEHQQLFAVERAIASLGKPLYSVLRKRANLK